MDSIKKVIIATHNGSFHSDDIFGVATLCLLLEKENNIEIIRTRDHAILDKANYNVDVGDVYDSETNRFDHHQLQIIPRDNGIPYAAFGLVWKKFGMEICGSKEIANGIERRLVWPTDARDNGINITKNLQPNIVPYELHDLVTCFKNSWKEDESQLYDRFLYLVSVAKEILKREIIQEKDRAEGRNIILNIYAKTKNKKLLVLDKHYPFEAMGSQLPEVLLVVYPNDTDGNWCIECIRNIFESYESRIYLPQSWAGKTHIELEKETGVPGSIFCHKKAFFAVAKTKEAILKMAEIALADL